MNTLPLINGQRRDWSSISFDALGRTFTGITAVSYEDSVEKVNHYGAGNMPVHRGTGKYSATAKASFYAYEIDSLQAALPSGKRLQDIPPFDITVSYLDDSDQIINHVIRNCEFLTNKRDMKQGDTKIESEYEFRISHIQWS